MKKISLNERKCREEDCLKGKSGFKIAGKWRTMPPMVEQAAAPKEKRYVHMRIERPQIYERIMQLADKTGTYHEVFFTCEENRALNASISSSMEISFTSRLLKEASDSELLAIIAHELGHAFLGHSKRKLEERMLFFARLGEIGGLIRCALTGNLEQRFYGIRNFFGRLLNLIKYKLEINRKDRMREYEADRFAVMTGHGQGMIDFLQKCKEDIPISKRVWYALFPGSHPPINKRIAKVKEMMGQLEQKNEA